MQKEKEKKEICPSCMVYGLGDEKLLLIPASGGRRQYLLCEKCHNEYPCDNRGKRIKPKRKNVLQKNKKGERKMETEKKLINCPKCGRKDIPIVIDRPFFRRFECPKCGSAVREDMETGEVAIIEKTLVIMPF